MVAGVVAVAAGEEIVVVVEGIVVVVEEGAEAVTSNPEEAAMAAASVVTEAADVAALEETAAAVVAVLEVIVVAVVAVLGVIVVAVVASEVTGVAVASEVIVEDEAALTAADEVGVDEVVSAVSKTHLKMSLNSSVRTSRFPNPIAAQPSSRIVSSSLTSLRTPTSSKA